MFCRFDSACYTCFLYWGTEYRNSEMKISPVRNCMEWNIRIKMFQMRLNVKLYFLIVNHSTSNWPLIQKWHYPIPFYNNAKPNQIRSQLHKLRP